MGTAAVVTAVAATVSAVSTIKKGQAAKRVAEQNAAIAREQARAEAEAAKIRTRNLKLQREADIARARTAYAMSGAAQEGTPLEMLNRLESIAREEVALSAIEGQRRVIALRNQAAISEQEGSRLESQSFLDAAGGLLGSTSDFLAIKGG